MTVSDDDRSVALGIAASLKAHTVCVGDRPAETWKGDRLDRRSRPGWRQWQSRETGTFDSLTRYGPATTVARCVEAHWLAVAGCDSW